MGQKIIAFRVSDEEADRMDELAELMHTSKVGVLRYFLKQSVVTRAAVPMVPAIVELAPTFADIAAETLRKMPK